MTTEIVDKYTAYVVNNATGQIEASASKVTTEAEALRDLNELGRLGRIDDATNPNLDHTHSYFMERGYPERWEPFAVS